MGVRLPSVNNRFPRKYISPGDQSPAVKASQYLFYGGRLPWTTLNVSSGGVPALPTASATQADTCFLPGNFGGTVELYQRTAQTLLPALDNTNGFLNIGLDQVNNEAVEYVPGGNNLNNPFLYTPGTSPAVRFRANLYIEDVSGLDNSIIGWRKMEAYVADTLAFATDALYTDFIGVGISVSGAGKISIVSDINNSGTSTITETGYTLADGKWINIAVTLRGTSYEVTINGMPLGQKLTVDGIGGSITAVQLASGHSITLDTSDTFVPFLHLQQNTDVSLVRLRELEVGFVNDLVK